MPFDKHVDYHYESCQACKWFRRRLWKSGLHPIYHSECEHPTKLRPDYWDTGKQRGTFISESNDRRPGWCPIRGDVEAEKEATKEWDSRGVDEDE